MTVFSHNPVLFSISVTLLDMFVRKIFVTLRRQTGVVIKTVGMVFDFVNCSDQIDGNWYHQRPLEALV